MRIVVNLVLLIILSISILNAQKLSSSDESFIDSIMTVNYKSEEPCAVILVIING